MTQKRKSRSQPTARGPTGTVTLRDRFRGKRPVFEFVGFFVIFMASFYYISTRSIVDKRVIPNYMRFNARASAAVLNLLGEGASVHGTSVSSPRYSVDIRHGCDAIEPSALFIAAVLAFPSTLRSKLPGLVAGTVVLALINLVRIVSLFYTGIYFPRAFEVVHVDVWQPIFILLALTLWVIWALWATRRQSAVERHT